MYSKRQIHYLVGKLKMKLNNTPTFNYLKLIECERHDVMIVIRRNLNHNKSKKTKSYLIIELILTSF